MKKTKFTSTLQKENKQYVDLHMHSTHSDGDYKVHELIDTCVKKGMTAMSITDHDNIEAYNEGKAYAEELNIEFVPGVEISTFYENTEIHMLGYYYSPNHLVFNQSLLEIQEKRVVRVRNIVKKLNAHGIEIRFERVQEKAKGKSIGRPHIAAVMLEEEYINNIGQAFEKYLCKDFVKEFEGDKLTPAEAISLINQAGGVSVLAHPFRTERDDLIEGMVEAGLQGIETYCNGLSASHTQKYKDYAKKYNLVKCGGADFHSDKYGSRNGLGSIKVPYSSLEQLKELHKNKCCT